MLAHLQLKDLVIVDSAELELAGGLTALTGETGAGKSIVVDALLLIAGGRAGSDVVRQGAERAEVSATFTRLPPAALVFLEAQSIEHEGELIVRRVIGADGRSRAYLNGQVVPLQALRELADSLIEIHGQQEFQRLVNRAAQRELLDARLEAPETRRVTAEAFERYQAARRAHQELEDAVKDRDARLDLLRYQVQELKSEVSSAEAIEELFAEVKRFASKGKLGSAAQGALDAVSEAEGANAHDLLGRAQSALRAAADTDPTLAQALGQLGEAAILTQEAAQSLRHYLEGLDVDPARQEELERQAAALEGMARKHRVAVGELPAVLSRLEAELSALDDASSSLAALKAALDAALQAFRRAADGLSRGRKAAAKRLGEEVGALMQALSMAGGRFQVAVTATSGEPCVNGVDDIEFLVSANPGQPLKPLARVASGGELSRISLAIQVAAAGGQALCMVFDEVDAGIGGAVAEIVGKQLRELGAHNQVLCVTHLAQVASQAHQQYRVLKLTDGKLTRTDLKALSADERVEEIARMLGGIDITAQARAHAREMLERSGPARPASSDRKKRARAGR